MNQATSTAPDFIKNKPTLGTAAASATTDFDASGAATSAQSAAASDATTKANAAQSAAASDATTKASAAQAAAIQRANQTGTQTASTISDFNAAAIQRAPVGEVVRITLP